MAVVLPAASVPEDPIRRLPSTASWLLGAASEAAGAASADAGAADAASAGAGAAGAASADAGAASAASADAGAGAAAGAASADVGDASSLAGDAGLLAAAAVSEAISTSNSENKFLLGGSAAGSETFDSEAGASLSTSFSGCSDCVAGLTLRA